MFAVPRTSLTRGVLAVLAALCCASVTAAATSRPKPGPRDTGKLLILCRPNLHQRATVDPLEHYGEPRTMHNHTPAGAMAFKSRSTVAQMLAAPTSCTPSADHSMLWIPTPLQRNGKPATIRFIGYYMINSGYRIRRLPPDGLRFVAGDPMCKGNDCPAIYGCPKRHGGLLAQHMIPTARDGCDTRGGQGYVMTIYSAGQCWNRASLGEGMGGSGQPATITKGAPCHGQVIPTIQLVVNVGANGIGGHLSSDVPAGTAKSSPGSTGHFDYVFGWKNDAQGDPLGAVIKRCLDATAFPIGEVSCKDIRNPGGSSTIYETNASTEAPEFARPVTDLPPAHR
jgi:hypothetical protein